MESANGITHDDIRTMVLESNAAQGCTRAEVDAGTPVLYVQVGRNTSDRNSRRGWLAHYAWAVRFPDGTVAVALDSERLMSTQPLRRYEAAGSGVAAARKAFAGRARLAGVPLEVFDACR